MDNLSSGLQIISGFLLNQVMIFIGNLITVNRLSIMGKLSPGFWIISGFLLNQVMILIRD